MHIQYACYDQMQSHIIISIWTAEMQNNLSCSNLSCFWPLSSSIMRLHSVEKDYGFCYLSKITKRKTPFKPNNNISTLILFRWRCLALYLMWQYFTYFSVKFIIIIPHTNSYFPLSLMLFSNIHFSVMSVFPKDKKQVKKAVKV